MFEAYNHGKSYKAFKDLIKQQAWEDFLKNGYIKFSEITEQVSFIPFKQYQPTWSAIIKDIILEKTPGGKVFIETHSAQIPIINLDQPYLTDKLILGSLLVIWANGVSAIVTAQEYQLLTTSINLDEYDTTYPILKKLILDYGLDKIPKHTDEVINDKDVDDMNKVVDESVFICKDPIDSDIVKKRNEDTYCVILADDETTIRLPFQNGDPLVWANGLTNEALLMILLDRTKRLNKELPSNFNLIAIANMQNALDAFNNRNKERAELVNS